MLAGMYSIITSSPNIFVTWEEGFHLLQLVVFAFLGPEYLQVVEEDLLGDDRKALAPAIAFEGVASVIVADVVGPYLQGGEAVSGAAAGYGDSEDGY